jgi:hypothetical protein
MLQVFHLDVAKVDMDVAYDGYTCMYLSVCFKCFVCFQSYVASVSIGCFKSTSRGAHVVIALVAEGNSLLQPPATTVGAAPWVTMRASEADRCLHDAHSQAR